MLGNLSTRRTRITVGIFFLLMIGASFAMSILNIKLPLSQDWKERLQDATKLNDYAKGHPVEIKNASIENLRMDGIIITNGKFENTTWKEVTAKKVNLTNTVIYHSLLEKVDFSHSILTDVTFEEVDLRGVRFYNATLANVRFINCSFNGTNIDQTIKSQILVTDSDVISTSFSEGQLIAAFKNTKFYKGVELTDLQSPSSLTFEKSELDGVNMERSTLNDLQVRESKFDVIYDSGSVDNIFVEHSVLDASLSALRIKQLKINDTEIKNLSVLRSQIKEASLTKCISMNNFGMFESKVDVINFDQCHINDYRPIEAIIGSMSIKNSIIRNSKFKKIKIKAVNFENVTLEGELDFSGAQVGEQKINNVTKQPGLKIITVGSNVRL